MLKAKTADGRGHSHFFRRPVFPTLPIYATHNSHFTRNENAEKRFNIPYACHRRRKCSSNIEGSHRLPPQSRPGEEMSPAQHVRAFPRHLKAQPRIRTLSVKIPSKRRRPNMGIRVSECPATEYRRAATNTVDSHQVRAAITYHSRRRHIPRLGI